jgi:hypothetical protein
MLVLFPERINHPLFWLEFFGSEEFNVSFVVVFVAIAILVLLD